MSGLLLDINGIVKDLVKFDLDLDVFKMPVAASNENKTDVTSTVFLPSNFPRTCSQKRSWDHFEVWLGRLENI